MHRFFVAVFLMCEIISANLVSFLTNVSEDVGLNILELVPKHGYHLERHLVTTEDGYILETHRISKTNVDRNLPPILFVHGIASSSIDWINGGSNASLAYAFVDLGFDVWLANNRGTKYSRRHTVLNPDIDKKEFWHFTFHELGVYDNPALIDYILLHTRFEKVIYIGFSQGTTAFFVMNIERPEYNNKILFAHLLGPVAFWSNTISPSFRYGLTLIEKQLVIQQDHIQLYEFLPRSVNEMFWPSVCAPHSPFFQICKLIMNLIVGRDHQLQDNLVPIITGSLPAGGSLRQYLHFNQLLQNGRFCKFNYRSTSKNIHAYGQEQPPDYNLAEVTAPVITHFGVNDWLLNDKDAAKTTSMLPNVLLSNRIKYPRFTHANFLWGKDIFDILYNDIINITLQYVYKQS